MSHQVINASQVRGNFYGGLPYNVNWNFNGGNSPSTLTVSVVNEAGRYSTPRLSFKSESVRIGNFNFNGYLTEYEIKSSASQAILDLTYTDQSIDLDRYFVALRHKHGGPSLGLKNVIYVGKQYHPCDKNLDSTLAYQETFERQIDNCDPCPFMPEDKYDFACDPRLKEFEIFEVYYTFNELIQKMPRQFNVKLDAKKYNFYKAQHIGTLRNVLDSWCGDLGLSYFWDPVKNQLSFIDRKKPIRIPNAPNDREIIDLNQGSTISNTFARGFIGSFEKAAELKDYTCEEESKETLKCLNVQDLFAKDKAGGASSLANPEAPLEADIRELTSIVSYLGREARTAFLWFWYYQNLGPQETKRLIITESKKGEDDDSSRKTLTYLGNMKIIDVYSRAFQETDKDKYFKFMTCNAELSEIDRKRFRDEDIKRGRDPDTDPSYYFILAEVDEELAERQLETDTVLAREFLGKFWYKKFRVRVPGATNENSQVTVETPEGEGSAQWYPVDEDLVTLPIFGFGHQSKSFIGEIVKNIDKDQKENEESIDQAREAAKNFEKNKITLRNLHSFILMERNTKWHIPGGEEGSGEDALKWYDSLFKWYKDVSPQIYGNAEGRPDFLKKLDPNAEKNSNYKLFICRDLRGTRDPNFEVKFQQVIHPDEPKKRKNKTEDVEDVYGNTITINKGLWGLVDNKCIRIKMPGITFFPPVQALGNNRFIKSSDGESGFDTYVTASATFKKYIPKQELIYSIDVNNTNCAQVDYNIQQIQEDNLSKLNAGKCLIDRKAFAAYVGEIAQFSAYTQSQASRKMSFKTAGIFPVKYSVEEGLSSVNIEVSDNGIFTSYNFEDSIVQPPSDSYIDQYMRDLLKPKKSVGYLTPYSQQGIDRVRASVRG